MNRARITVGLYKGKLCTCIPPLVDNGNRQLVFLDGSASSVGLRAYHPADLESVDVVTPPLPPAAFQVGLVAGRSGSDLINSLKLGVKRVRVGVDLPCDPASIVDVMAGYRGAGIEVVLLCEFAERLPTQADVTNIVMLSHAYPEVRFFEFGNETSYGYQYHDASSEYSYHERARTYALRAYDTALSLKATGPGAQLLVQAEDGGSGTSVWVDQMYTAEPKLHEVVGGWVVHPYGPDGITKVTRMQKNLAAHGAPDSIPIWATEFGLTTTPSGTVKDRYWDVAYDFVDGAAALTADVTRLKAAGVDVVMLYQVADQSPGAKDDERYFGLLAHDGTAKGVYTDTAKSLLAL